MKSIRIQTKPNDGEQYVKINLQQSFDILEILSLKLTQSEIYRKFAADYGVVVGRVIANRGFGVPNAKVSIFIPLDENESNVEIIGRYPFKTPLDIDNDGIRYNLLEDSKQHDCHKPVGTFPNKRKMLDNDVWLEIYDKYYKFTTTTNQAGDYMIFGVPIGNQKIHMDVDISDIGFVSLKPYELINQGYTPNLFESNTTFKSGTDLDSLVQIQKRDFAVNVLPFWGDLNENEIGINRVDFNLGIDITPTALFFGSIFTSEKDHAVHKLCVPRPFNGGNCQMTTGVGNVEIIRRISVDSKEVEFIQSNATKIDEYGVWSISLPMNLDTVVTDEFGNLIPSEDPNIGIPTRARVRCRMSLSESIFGFEQRTAHYLVPNLYNRYTFNSDTLDEDMVDLKWKKVYTVTNYIPRYQMFDPLFDETPYYTGIKFIGNCEGKTSFPYNRIDSNLNPLYNILCILVTAVGEFIDFLNMIIRFIIFEIVLSFVCTLQYLFDPAKRGACRCAACLDLNTEENDPLTPPPTWDGSIDNFNPPSGNTIDDRLECAACFEHDGGKFSIKTTPAPYELVGSITTNITDGVDNPYPNTYISDSSLDGHSAVFTITVVGNTVTSIIVTSGGEQFVNGEVLTFYGSLFGASTDLIVTLTTADLQTIIVIDGQSIDCENFDISYCDNQCLTCEASIIKLQCDDDFYYDGTEWADCVKQNLAEDLGVITYEFYNDWVIGSLYAILFDYSKINKLDRFCGYDCIVFGSIPDPNDPLGENVCVPSLIADKQAFVDSTDPNATVIKTLYTPLIPPNIPPPNPNGGGLIEYENGLLYYTARNDVAKITNPLTPVPDLTVSEKENLMFATNIIELGSAVRCDLDGKPYLVDRLSPTTHRRSEGNGTLYDVTNCGLPILDKVNRNGIQLISQAGVEIVVDETQRVSTTIISAGGEEYTLIGSQNNLPDYDTATLPDAIILINRRDVILRRYLCENFPYFNTIGSYSTTNHPTGGDYLEDASGNPVETLTDECSGYDDFTKPSDKMPPYYMYFGMAKGNTALDKLKKLYFDNCV